MTGPAPADQTLPSRAARLRWFPPAAGILAIVLTVQFVVFDQIGAPQHTRIFPRWNDQIQYLTEAYTGHEYAKVHGMAAGVWQALTNPSAQGTLHDVYAILLFQVVGPSRSAALAINLLALIAWQVALYAAVRRSFGSDWLGLGAALLPLALYSAWNGGPGSAIDFRLDHLAMCTFGVALCAGLMTDRFAHRGWSVVFGLTLALTLLTRFLSGAYWVAIVGLLGFVVLPRPGAWRRFGNLLLAVGIAAAVAAPVFWLNRDWIWNYYWIGHFVGPESAIRSPNLGLMQSVDWLVRHFQREHIGTFFPLVAAAVGGALWFTRRSEAEPTAWGWLQVGAAFLIGPAVVLVLHAQKSSVVLSVLAPGLVIVVVALWALVMGTQPREPRVAAAALVASAVVLGWYAQLQSRPANDPGLWAEMRHASAIGDRILVQANALGIERPRVGVDHVSDALDGQILRVTTYERTGKFIPFEMALPTGIFEPSDELVFQRLQSCDFVFITLAGGSENYPYDTKLKKLRPQLQAWCQANLALVEEFSLHGRQLALYQRTSRPGPTAP